MNFDLLNKLTHIYGPSGDEIAVRDFILEYVYINQEKWKVQPTVLFGEDFQNNLILVFGKPEVAVFTHIDSIGFTTRYENQLVPIGGPATENGYPLRGKDRLGLIECSLHLDEDGYAFHDFPRPIERGTNLIWNSKFEEKSDSIQGPYMDNRLGVFISLLLAETLENGAIVFSTWEEHHGGAVPYLIKYLYDSFNLRKTIICDITWITEGVIPGKGVVISMRDKNIPRRAYVEKIIDLAKESEIPFQLEVEGGGSSDGREIQQSPYPIDWIFIGAAEENVHSPYEKVHKNDVQSMLELYRYLMKHL